MQETVRQTIEALTEAVLASDTLPQRIVWHGYRCHWLAVDYWDSSVDQFGSTKDDAPEIWSCESHRWIETDQGKVENESIL